MQRATSGLSKACDHETRVPVCEGSRAIVKRYLGSETCFTTIFFGGSSSANTLSLGYFAPLGPCMVKDHRPPFLNSQTLKVFVKPAGPHHRARRSDWLNAANTCSRVAGISHDVLNVD